MRGACVRADRVGGFARMDQAGEARGRDRLGDDTIAPPLAPASCGRTQRDRSSLTASRLDVSSPMLATPVAGNYS
jgi:hypothetical protein